MFLEIFYLYIFRTGQLIRNLRKKKLKKFGDTVCSLYNVLHEMLIYVY